MNNKEKNTRIVTFKDDYASKAGAKEGKIIYRKGSVHAIHHLVVKSLQEKGAKMDVKKFDPEPGIARLKKQRAENIKALSAIK